MTRKDVPRVAAALGLCAAGIAWSSVGSAGSVETALVNEGASAGVINAGIQIQNLCTAMKNAGYKAPVSGGAIAPAGSGASESADNLFLRCNEIVQTANALTDSGPTARSLGFGGLASTVQQINGEETNAQSALALRVPSGQFSNIGARLNALRYGTSASFDHITAANTGSDPDAPVLANLEALHREYQAWNDLAAYNSSTDWRVLPVSYLTDNGGVGSDSSQSGGTSSYRPEHDSPLGIFTEGGYGWGHRDETTNEDAFRYHSYSVTVGTDYRFANAAVGASVGFDRYSASFNIIGASPGQSPAPPAVDGGDARVDGYSGSLFALWYLGNFSVNGIVTYGHLNSDVTRIVDYTGVTATCTNCGPGSAVALRGDPDGHFAAGAVTAQYDLSVAGIDISPSVSANYRRATIESYTENDPSASGLALQYGEQNIESLRSIVGLNFAHVFSTSFGVLTPNLKAEWHHEFRDQPYSVIMRYATEVAGVSGSAAAAAAGNFGFSSPTDKPESNFGIVGVGLTSLFANRLQSYIYYERLVGVPYLTDNAISVGVRAQF